MGLQCQISRKDDVIDRVEAPNGESSILYEKALQLLGNKEHALEVWAKAYTSGFLAYYGYWNNPSPGEVFNTDQNGEPLLEDVMAYMKRQTYFMDPFTSRDVKDIRFAMAAVPQANDISSLSSAIRSSFYVNGNLVLNEHNLRNSGLYSEDEISRIMSNPNVLNDVTSFMRSILDYSNNEHDSEKEAHFMSVEPSYGPIVYREGVYNQLGKKVPYNPSELYEAIRNKVGGISSQSDFQSGIEELRDSYPEFVERFISDKEFASSIFDEFSSMTSIPVVDIENGEVIEGKRSSLSKLQNLSYYNPNKIEFLRARIAAYLNRANADTEEDLRSMIWDIEEACTWFGIDIIGVSKVYDSTEESLNMIDDLMVDIDIYASRRCDAAYAPALSASMDSLLGDSSAKESRKLPSYMDGYNIVYSESKLSPVDMFDRFSLLKIGENLYHKVNKDDLSDLYNAAVTLAKYNQGYFPSAAYPSSCFKNGSLDKSSVENEDDANIIDSMRRYVLSFTDSQNTEAMVMTRLAFRHSPVPAKNSVNQDREFSKYMAGNQNAYEIRSLSDLYQSYLENKLHDTELYNNVFKYFNFKSESDLSLSVSDAETLKSIELSLEGKDREALFNYVMSSTDPSVSDLFYLPKQDPMYAGSDFRHYLYSKHPDLLNEKKEIGITEKDGVVIAEGVYDGFIKVNGEVLTKINESSSGSIYQRLDGSESEVKYNSTQKEKKTDVSYSPYKNISGLKQDMTISKDESNELKRMECN